MMETNVEDLKAFERRFKEIVDNHQPMAYRWRLIFGILFLVVIVTGYFWWIDPEMAELSYLQQVYHHRIFAVALFILLLLLMARLHQRIFAPQLILLRTNDILDEYNLNVDSVGRLILLYQNRIQYEEKLKNQ